MENKVQVISCIRETDVDAEWIELILMARQKGFTKEEVRTFLLEAGQTNQSE